MSENRALPKGWEHQSLQDITTEKDGLRRGPFGSAIKKAFFVPSGYKIYEQGNAIYDDPYRGNYFINEEKYLELDNFRLLPGDLIVSCSGTLGRISEIPNNAKPGIINQALLRIRLKRDLISNEYFIQYFRSAFFQTKLIAQSQGTAISNLIGIKDFKEIEILIPPFPEQHRIVSKIEELFSGLDKGVESLKTAQQQLKIYRQAVLKWAFEGKLTNKNVVDGELPGGWSRVSLKETLDRISDGPFGSNLKTSDYVDNGVRVIRLENIGYMEFRNEFQSFVTDCKYGTIKKHTVSKGDIIVSSFVSENIRAAVLPDFIDKAINKADCFLVRPCEDKVCNKYLLFYFSTREMYQQLIGEIHGATRPRVNTTQLKLCQIPVTSLSEQNRIVAEIESRLSVCDRIEESIEHSLKQAESLRQSILKKAFEGKLVTQDPNDEPASVLLARIKAERENDKRENPQHRQIGKTKKKKATS